MADDSKKTDKSNNNNGSAGSNTVKPSGTAVASSNNSNGSTTPTWTKPSDTSADTKPAPTANKGGEKMAKDPEGMFDYSKCQTYTVKKGDTLFDVAQKFEVALQQLRYFNHLDKATWRIKEGQTLYIPTKPIYVPTGK
ncbi:MAG: LysM domain protein [Caudoviricetes sp.]|nr:MAG: LysM domain protein [Caudoviricetes sp.]